MATCDISCCYMESQIAWAAGLFDGEGCLVIRKPSKSCRAWVLQLNLSNTHRPALEQFIRIVDVGHLRFRTFKPKNQWRTVWTWQTASRKAEQVLRILLPYLVIKRVEAELALEFQALPLIRHGQGGKRTLEEDTIREVFHLKLQRLKQYDCLPTISRSEVPLGANSKSCKRV